MSYDVAGREWVPILIAMHLKDIIMNTAPVLPNIVNATPQGIKPAFEPVITSDRHACLLGAIATISATTLEDVFGQAEQLGLPKVGPYFHSLHEEFLIKLLARYGWVSTVWKECSKTSELPDLSIGLIDYHSELEMGRAVVIHRAKRSDDGKPVVYAIEVAANAPVRVRSDPEAVTPAWYLGIHPMNLSSTSKK